MASDNMIELQRRWRAFSADRAKAKRLVQEQDDKDNAEIARLREAIITRNSEFDDKWRQDKIELQKARDEAVMQAMSGPDGRSAQSILRDLGSNNTVWIYELRGRLQALGALPEQVNVNTYTASENVQQQQVQQQAAQLEETEAPTDVVWLHHNHQGVVGWLLSEDRALVKRYGAEQSDFEGQWFTAERESKEYVAGSQELYDATPKGEITRKANLLEALIDETHTGRVKLVDNPYTS
jgi:hypothetical protein